MADQQASEVLDSQVSSPLEIESLPSSTGVEEISKAEEFKYLLDYQVFLDEVVFKKYALYTTLDFNFSALVREIEADNPRTPSMQLAKTIARSTVISSASLRRGIQKNAAAFGSTSRSDTKEKSTRYQDDSGDLEEAQPRTKKRNSATSALLEAANKRRHEEELDSTEPSYKRHLLEKHRCCVQSCTNNGNTYFVRGGQRHFPISAKNLNDWNESIKIGHATVHSLPSSLDPLPAKGTSSLGYADHPLARPSSPAPYPQLPPQYWHQSASYPPPPAISITQSFHPITVLFLCQLETQLLR
ncbi:hypothetical protein V1520DRAFT_372392 [Lipomyces starkeyi]|uniref:Uncharacterized protein n=1 Tax=Lipomyces starkeyi NRRL Y-11557 TaxID=675824 RepID=A0A1E3Q8B4_LIPST|nr:hypothetical protein LIPSTDRAFT_62671 [Lipomyces starkeyi NRRL Y-11557]